MYSLSCMPFDSLVVDSMFEQSENVIIARFHGVFEQLLLAYSEECGLGSKFVWLSSAHAHCINGQS